MKKIMKKTVMALGMVSLLMGVAVVPNNTVDAACRNAMVMKSDIHTDSIEANWLFCKTYIVTGDKVNVRTGLGTNYSGIGYLYYGDEVKVKEIDLGWAKIKYNGKWRYVCAKYLKKK